MQKRSERRFEDRSFAWALTRRQVLLGAGAVVGGLAAWPRALLADEPFALSSAARDALGKSPLVYISPLRKNGSESRCHGEVWFFFDEGDVVIFTARDRWKARAVESDRDRARIWVGDFGPIGRAGDRYRSAPTFLARARIDTSDAAFARLMSTFSTRYADEWGKWGPRFQKGWEDGTRVMIRYSPTAA